MKVGRLIGDVIGRIPGAGEWIGRLRFSLRMDRRARRHLRGGGPQRRYAEWVRRMDTPAPAELAALRRRAESIHDRPLVSLLMVVEDPDPALLDRTLHSIRMQAYPRWEARVVVARATAAARAVLDRHAAAEPRVTVHGDVSADSTAAGRNAALAAARGGFVAMIDSGDVLPPQGLLLIAEAIDRQPDAGLVYADEDQIDGAGRRHDPWFKSDCNRELLLTHDSISRPAFYSRRLVCDLGGWRDGFPGAEDHDLALRAVAAVGPRGVVHVPRILCHRGVAAAEGHTVADAGRRAVADLLRRQGSAAVVEPAPEAPDCHRIRHPLPAAPPLVSIIICTRDHERLLRTAVDSIAARTTYTRVEIVIVDNGSVEPGAVAHLAALAARPDVRVLRDESPFNYSRLNNRGAAAARGEVLCLLNDDIEVLTPDWLEELVSYVVQPDVGAVGARLWYPDGTLQHGGVIVGICGAAGHAHPRLQRGDRGYFSRAVLAQELSAVTAACLVVRAEVFRAVSGLDERMAVAFNDVDFCLRLREAGYRNIWTPYAELVHHESASRGCDDTPSKRARSERELALLREGRGDAARRDPFYNPNLSHTAADFSVDAPRLWRRGRVG
jgi:GT2 family glycosyltransferase